MRKKLFAVIMSAMMMVTFMPAMAFAGFAPASNPNSGFAVDGTTVVAVSPVAETTKEGTDLVGTYDGVTNTITYVLSENDAKTFRLVDYSVQYWAMNKCYTDAKGKLTGYGSNAATSTALHQTTAPTVKDAGIYRVTVQLATIPVRVDEKSKDAWVTFAVLMNQRPVHFDGFNTVVKSKAYDGEGFALTDKDFTITPCLNPKTKAYDLPGTGLVAGDTLISGAFKTNADVGTYKVTFGSAAFNQNYYTEGWDNVSWKCYVEITKAENYVKLPKTNKTYKAAALKKGAKSFALKATAEFGTAKITKVQGSGNLYVKNGKVVVKKGTKKGTYKMTVNAHVQGTTNWAAADCKKVVCVKVR